MGGVNARKLQWNDSFFLLGLIPPSVGTHESRQGHGMEFTEAKLELINMGSMTRWIVLPSPLRSRMGRGILGDYPPVFRKKIEHILFAQTNIVLKNENC